MNNFKLILFSNEDLLFDANYRLSKYKDYLVQMVDAISDFHYMKRIENIFHESATPLIIIQEGVVVKVNEAYLELFGFKKEDILGKLYNFSTKNSLNMSLSERKKILQKILDREIYYHEDERCFLNAKGEKVYIKSIIFPVTYLNRVAAQINLIDITTSFIFEENLDVINKELNKLVDEKNMLLKEVHHRVKNNLQIMLSLINLDSRYNPNESDKVLESAKNRINAMVLMHEKIYRSSDLAHVNIKEYIETEVDYLFDLYGVENINLNYLLEDLELSMDTAIPLGLIINEMVINVIKYAFPNGEEGELSIILHLASNKITLILADNGVGAPKDLDAEHSTSLGLTVVRGLVNQINGSITRLDRPGTAYMIEFLLE